MKPIRGFLYDRWNQFLHELPIYDGTLHEQINGEDSVELVIDRPLAKGDRLLFNDAGRWREYVYDQGTQRHEAGQTYSAIFDNSFMWDFSQRIIRYTRWEGATCAYAVGELVKMHPLWSTGTIMATSSKILEYSEETVYKALLETAGAFGCEISYDITVDKNGVVRRTVNFIERVGKETEIRFDYGNGLYGVEKTILADKVVTAVYGIGSTVNDQDLWCYEKNDDLLKVWGLPAGKNGEVIHSEDIYSNPDIEDQATLRTESRKYLDAHSAPAISYTTQIPFVALAGARLGDTVSVVDKDFNPPLRLRTRIGQMDRNLMTGEVTSCVFGTVISLLPDALARSINREKIIVKQTGVIGGLRSDLKNTQDQLHSTQNSLSESQRTVSDLQRRLSSAETALAYAESDLEDALQDAAAAKKQANDLAATVDSQERQLDNLEGRVSDLEDHYRSAQAAANYYGIVASYHGMCTDGSTPMQQWIKDNLRMYKADYDSHPDAALSNPTINQWYNELMAMPVGDEPLPGPSIEDQGQTGPSIEDEPIDATPEEE